MRGLPARGAATVPPREGTMSAFNEEVSVVDEWFSSDRFREITRLLQGANFDQSLGTIIEPARQFTVRTMGTLESLSEIRNLVIRTP